jgi:hypothetical protein
VSAVKVAAPDLPTGDLPAEGRHLVDGRRYRVHHNRQGGYRVARQYDTATQTSKETAVAAYRPGRHGLRVWGTPQARADVALILADPTATAAAYTHGTGCCSCCGVGPLTDPEGHVCRCKKHRETAGGGAS